MPPVVLDSFSVGFTASVDALSADFVVSVASIPVFVVPVTSIPDFDASVTFSVGFTASVDAFSDDFVVSVDSLSADFDVSETVSLLVVPSSCSSDTKCN